MDNDSVILIFQGGNGTFDRKSRIHLMSDIDFLPNCSSADVCNSVWYCFENPFITAIGITASFFAAAGLLANSLSLYKICRRGVKLSPTMTMIGVLSASNCISIVVSYLPFLAHFGYLADTEHTSLKFKILAILTVSCITISGFYVAQLVGLRLILLQYPLSSLRRVTSRRIVYVAILIFFVNLIICTSFQFSNFHFFPSTDPLTEYKTRTIKKQILLAIPLILVITFHFLKKQNLRYTRGAKAISRKMSVTVTMVVVIHVLSWIVNLLPMIAIFCIEIDKIFLYSHPLFYITLLAWMIYYTFIPVILVFRSNFRSSQGVLRHRNNRNTGSVLTSRTSKSSV